MKRSIHAAILVLVLIIAGIAFGLYQKSEPVVQTEEAHMSDGESVSDVGVENQEPIILDANSELVQFDVAGFNYGYDKSEIRVKEGDTVTIAFTSTEGYHDWVLDEFDVASEKIRTGETTYVTFIADKKGTFEYYCSVGSHRAEGMVGNLIVE